LLEQYAKEVEIDTSIDATNVMDKQMSAPNVKHKWLYRLMQARMQLLKYTEEKEAILQAAIEHNPARLKISNAAIKASVESKDEVKALNTKINRYTLLVDYLDGVVNKIYTQIGFDFKNLVELMKMEQL
jgi:hypothetical protein